MTVKFFLGYIDGEVFFWVHDEEFSTFRVFFMSGDVRFARLIWGLIELVLGCYPCTIVFGTSNHNGHYCAETCRPHFTKLMTVRLEGESVDWRVGIWSLRQYSLEIDFHCFFFKFSFAWFSPLRLQLIYIWDICKSPHDHNMIHRTASPG